jgi:Cdc6-like AAA superfamily ATPase
LLASSIADRGVVGLDPPNEVQLGAVQHAMTHSFSLIQGPPGTGKTVTAVRLASLFVQLNRQLTQSHHNEQGVGPQVMICGPSNKSVDVVAGKQI